MSLENESIYRVLEWYDRETECLIGEEMMPDISLQELRDIFDIRDLFPDEHVGPVEEGYDPYMSYKYCVTEKHLARLQPFVTHDIALNKYDYFIAAYSRNSKI